MALRQNQIKSDPLAKTAPKLGKSLAPSPLLAICADPSFLHKFVHTLWGLWEPKRLARQLGQQGTDIGDEIDQARDHRRGEILRHHMLE